VAACVDKSCHLKTGHDAEAAALLGRLLTPVTKYWVCKRTPPLVAEALEVTGGNGYVEDGPMPRLFRQSPLNSIWEGAGNVMCLDVLRVFAREPKAVDALLAVLERARAKHAIYDRALDALKKSLRTATVGESDARVLTEHIALLTQAALLLHDGVTPVAEAFCASRLDGHPGRAFGSLARNTAFNDILDRAGP
jgi:putative acyl-CoA dehydrogenase